MEGGRNDEVRKQAAEEQFAGDDNINDNDNGHDNMDLQQ